MRCACTFHTMRKCNARKYVAALLLELYHVQVVATMCKNEMYIYSCIHNYVHTYVPISYLFDLAVVGKIELTITSH